MYVNGSIGHANITAGGLSDVFLLGVSESVTLDLYGAASAGIIATSGTLCMATLGAYISEAKQQDNISCPCT